MPVLIGELEKITGSPSSVTQVMVRAHTTRITGSALTTDELVPIPVDRQGRFEVPLRPGKAVLVLVHGGRVGEGERFPMLVEEGLGTITSAIKLASDRFDDYELDELERAAADMLASLDRGLVAATRAEVAKEDAEKARDKAGEHRDDAEKAAGTAAEDAATSAVQKADEKLSGYVTAAEGHAEDSKSSATSAGKDAGRAEAARKGAETIQQGLPDKIGQELEAKLPGELETRVPAELDKHLPGELDERVPPLVASSIADDRAVADAAAAAIEGAVDEAMPTKADITYVDQRSEALGRRITNEKWWRGNLSVGVSADTLSGSASAGLWTVGASAPGLPRSGPGWVEVTYDGYSGRTKQTFSASTEVDDTIYTRTYAGGKWTAWVGTSVKGIPVSAGSVDSLRTPGDYYIANNSSVAGLPVAAQGPFEVLTVNSAKALTQRFTAATAGNSVWVRSTMGADAEWGEWERLGGAPARDRPITYLPELTTRSGGELLYAMSHDRTYGYNCLGHSLKITYDHGHTWKEVHVFGGQQMESTHILDNGELLITTNRGGWREVYVSTGLPANPESPVFTKVLDPAAFRVKFAAGWSISHHGNIVLLNEYGPKGGMVWDDIPEVPEGENARYTYLSLDYGKTWKTIFDLNEYLISEGEENTLRRHLHGVAWDPYWDRIWVNFGDNMGGTGSNGVVYSDDLGKTWHTAHHTSSTGQTWQVTSILPMPDKIYMGGDIYPSGFMSVDREGGKHRTTWNFDVAYQHPTGKHLCQAVQRVTLHSGETVGLAAFCSEGAAAKSFILGVREHGDIQLIWEDTIAQQSGMGLRWFCGPTLEGELIAAHNDLRVTGKYSELRGPIDLY